MSIQKNIQKFKLATMFSVMFAVAFIGISALFYYYNYTKQVDAQRANLKSQATSILDFADVLLQSRNEKFFSGESPEVPQIIQNEVFDKFTHISNGKVFFKQASKNPMSEKNLASSFEAGTIDAFNADKNLKEKEAIISEDGKDFYTLSRPIIAEEKCKMCHPAWNNGDVIAAENIKIELQDFYDALKNNTLLTIFTGIINISIILLLTHFLFSKHVSKRINKLLEIILRVEKGNFVIGEFLKDEDIEDKTSHNEIDKLFLHVKNMVDALRPVISNVVEASKNMAFQASYSYVKIDETNQYVNLQSTSIDHSKEKLDNVLDNNERISISLNELIDTSSESAKIVQQSKYAILNNVTKGNEAAVAMDETALSIEHLKEFSNEVSKTTEIITDIADETNLIALNAAIEAARAGEHGRSFAVVADKIRELADVSRANAAEIASVIAKIDSQINTVNQSATISKQSIISLVQNSHDMNKSFEKVEDAFLLIEKSLQTFHGDFADESKMLTNVNENLNRVKESSSILAQNAQTTEEVMRIISHKSGQLKSLADGFELVKNNREDERTVLTPPISGVDQDNHKIFVFDSSDSGISFYYATHTTHKNTNDRVTLQFDTPLHNRSTLTCEIRYASQEIMDGVNFYGAKII
ncbi:MAG: DUF3365 domain-containing protein [Sulfurospirillum sp.]|nr:DUF3365 domain-containing protein [Sulfurospirillum sp.]